MADKKTHLAVIGGVTTAEALEMVSVADREGLVLLSPSASSPQLTGISKNFFRIFISDFREGTKMGNFAAGQMELSSVVILAIGLVVFVIGWRLAWRLWSERESVSPARMPRGPARTMRP